MKNSHQSPSDKAKAVDELISNVSALGSAVTERVKESAMDAIQETFESAKQKTREALHNYDAKEIIKTYPKTSVAAAFAVGAFIGLRRFTIIKPAALALLSLGAEWMLKQQTSALLDAPDDKILH